MSEAKFDSNKEAIKKIHDICSGHMHCTDCPLFDPNADTFDEACIVGLYPYMWDVDKIFDILERLS